MTFHEKILSKLLEYQTQNPNFKFIPRQIVNERMKTGYWFQGTQNYAFVGLLNKSGGANRTKSLGLVFWPKKEKSFGCYVELVYKGETNKQLLSFYESIKTSFGGFVDKGGQKFQRYLPDTNESFANVYEFLDTFYPQLNNLAITSGIPKLFLSDAKFEKAMATINSFRTKTNKQNGGSINKLIINISWNSKNWKEESKDKSNHQWVRDGGIPGESWNFSYDAEGNTEDKIYGYAKFTHQPKIDGKSIFIFYSDGKIIGFYGDASLDNTLRNGHEMNLSGSKPLSFVLENKLENIIEKGYLEDGKRIGQIGFNYLDKNKTVISILDEALQLNPNQENEINQLKNWFTKATNSTDTNSKNKAMDNEVNLNQILFGPPGTGKTFNTINESLKIVDPSYFEKHQNDRKKLTERFKELLIKNSDENKGQIGFCTFHQSFSYEDFVEGIKPKTTDTKNVYYDIEPGIFKRICQLADSYNSTIKVKTEGKISWTEEQFNRASFYKLSLGNYQDPSDKPIYEYCRDNNYIAIGFGQENDFSGLSESEIIEKCEDLKLEVTAAQQMNYFIHYLKKNNYVIISNGNKYVRAIGKVTGDYEFVAESPISYNHFRKVEWLFVDELIPIEEIYERGLSQKTMYKIDESLLKPDFFINNGKTGFIDVPIKEEKNYVLIIDEINRGNVSQIFGELITLIEKDKRIGNEEALEVILPYSKEKFGVPANLYIIGTMNTADRSVEALDTALRRRFSFTEMMPNEKVIIDKSFTDYDRVAILQKINQRIEVLLDRNYTLGHSYFIKEDFKNSFENEIIPLLQEYFYNDYGKIGLVLGKGFVREKAITVGNKKSIFADFETKSEVDIVKSYELIPFNEVEFDTAIQLLLA